MPQTPGTPRQMRSEAKAPLNRTALPSAPREGTDPEDRVLQLLVAAPIAIDAGAGRYPPLVAITALLQEQVLGVQEKLTHVSIVDQACASLEVPTTGPLLQRAQRCYEVIAGDAHAPPDAAASAGAAADAAPATAGAAGGGPSAMRAGKANAVSAPPVSPCASPVCPCVP